ncbi:MAG: stress protein [Bacteroidota bacterium]
MKILHLIFLSLSVFVGQLLYAQPQFSINEADAAETSGNTVTCMAHQQGSRHFLYSGGSSELIDAFEISADGKLTPIASYKTRATKEMQGIRGIVTDTVHGKNLLFAGLKGESAVEVFEIADNGELKSIFLIEDTDSTYLHTVITLQVVHMENDSYLFAGGLEKQPGMSSYKIMPDGSLEHIQSEPDTDEIFNDGIIGMSIHRVDGKTFLFTGGFHDNGLSSFQVYEDGTFENVSNMEDTETRYLNGTYPVISSSIEGRNYVVVGHRHHIYYKPTPWVKDRDTYYYHGDAVSVFTVGKGGEIVPRSIFRGNSETFIQGQTRLQGLSFNEKYDVVAAATRDDQSIQLCVLDGQGLLTAAGKIKVGFPVYYGLAGQKIGDKLFLFAGSMSDDKMISYRLDEK